MPRFVSARMRGSVPVLSPSEYYNLRKRVLIIRETGGLGDIFMHRMLFEDFKLLMPEVHITFACPLKYHPAVYDHPHIDEVVDCRTVNTKDFLVSYNTTSACNRHESKKAPFSGKHRSDIWANHCGIDLTRHNMHICLEQSYIDEISKRLPKDVPKVALTPVSAMQVKNLLDWQLESIVKHLHQKKCFVFALHTKPIPILQEFNVPVWTDLSIRQWMGAIYLADYVVSADTAAFHLAGGINKPLTGIFTFADGKVYGKYYNFILVQKHRDNGDWDCGPCYTWSSCPKCSSVPKPCLTELTSDMIINGIDEMFNKWPVGF